MTKTPRKDRLLSLAHDLAMWASQIREHCEDKKNAPPHPNHIDSWLAEYRDALKRKSSKEGQ
jgi:hypothetical protein